MDAGVDSGSDASVDHATDADGLDDGADRADSTTCDSGVGESCDDAGDTDSGESCDSGCLGEACGEAITIAYAWRGLDLAIDGSRAYWIDYGSQRLRSVSLSGGMPAEVALDIGSYTVAVDAANLYWVSWTGVMKLPLEGGEPIPLATVRTDDAGSYRANVAFDIAIDATHLYYVDNEAGEVRKVPLAGGTPIVLASGQVGGYGVAVDATNVYWTIQVAGGSIRTVSKSGGTPTTLASDQSYPTDLAVDATSVYWVTSVLLNSGQTNLGGAVLKTPLAGGEPVVLASQQQLPTALTLDATHVYWVNRGTVMNDGGFITSLADGTVMSVPLNGGAPVTLAQGQSQPLALHVDANHVYWLSYGDQTSGGGDVKKTSLPRAACP